MRLDGRRESSNFEDRRGRGAASGGGFRFPMRSGMSLGTLAIIALIYFLMGGNPLTLLDNGFTGTPTQVASSTIEEQENLARFSRQILASTEDVWADIFKEMGLKYRSPKLVVYTDAVESACGQATSAVGPFYCSGDEAIYIDLDFFTDMHRTLGADGDFAYAYVIAHEVGHHVQKLLGILDQAHSEMASSSKQKSGQISVRLELQADFLAGVWGNRENAMFHSLEAGDVDEAINAATKIGDDYLQRKGQGYVVPDSFTHGTSAQRKRWLSRGLQTGDIWQGNTFEPAYNDL